KNAGSPLGLTRLPSRGCFRRGISCWELAQASQLSRSTSAILANCSAIAGITMVLYAQALPQIEDVYGHEAALSILSNCTSQLFFPPREPHTAELISRSFGSRLEVTQQATFESVSYGSRYQPEMEAAEVMSVPEGRLILFSRGLRHIVQDSRAAVLCWLPLLPAAPERLITAV